MANIFTGDPLELQLLPVKHTWAVKHYETARRNDWDPNVVNIGADNLSAVPYEHQELFWTVFSYLSAADQLAVKSITGTLSPKVVSAHVGNYLALQAAEEAVHNISYQRMILVHAGSDYEKATRHQVIPEIMDKLRFTAKVMKTIDDATTDTKDGLETIVSHYLFFSAVFEGNWFFNGFNPLFNLADVHSRHLSQTKAMLNYIRRDEAMHAWFGHMVTLAAIEEESLNTGRIADQYIELLKQGHALEKAYIERVHPFKLAGYSPEVHMAQFEKTANQRLESIHFPTVASYRSEGWGGNDKNNLAGLSSFFETRGMEYQSKASLTW